MEMNATSFTDSISLTIPIIDSPMAFRLITYVILTRVVIFLLIPALDVIVVERMYTSSIRKILRAYQARGVWDVGRWSPSGNQTLVWEGISPNENRLHILDVETGKMENLFPKERGKIRYGSAVWSKDGKSIYFVSDKDSEFRILRHLDLSTGNVRPLTAHIPWDIEQCITSPDGKYLALKINEDGFSTLHLLDTRTEKTQKVTDFPDGFMLKIDFHPQRNEIAFTNIPPEGLVSVYSYNVDNSELTHWTHSGSEDGGKLAAARLIHYPTFDKVDGKPRMISAFVFDAAAGFEGPRPVMIELHGGYAGQARPISSLPHNFLRKEGVTIIRPNFRGSSGYGKTFTTLDDGYSREDSVKDVGALIDWVSTQPNLDARRVAVMGGSYGGYMALASLIHYSDKLRCGIDLFGISNFVKWLENTEEYVRDYRRAEYGDERDPQMRAFLESISPVNQADKIRVPLLVFQGENDPRVPVSESRQMVERIRARGGEVWYIEAANEGHGLNKPQNGLYVGAVAFEFLKNHLLEKD